MEILTIVCVALFFCNVVLFRFVYDLEYRIYDVERGLGSHGHTYSGLSGVTGPVASGTWQYGTTSIASTQYGEGE